MEGYQFGGETPAIRRVLMSCGLETTVDVDTESGETACKVFANNDKSLIELDFHATMHLLHEI